MDRAPENYTSKRHENIVEIFQLWVLILGGGPQSRIRDSPRHYYSTGPLYYPAQQSYQTASM